MEILLIIFEIAMGLMMAGAFALALALAALALCIMIGHKADKEVKHEGDRLSEKD